MSKKNKVVPYLSFPTSS